MSFLCNGYSYNYNYNYNYITSYFTMIICILMCGDKRLWLHGSNRNRNAGCKPIVGHFDDLILSFVHWRDALLWARSIAKHSLGTANLHFSAECWKVNSILLKKVENKKSAALGLMQSSQRAVNESRAVLNTWCAVWFPRIHGSLEPSEQRRSDEFLIVSGHCVCQKLFLLPLLLIDSNTNVCSSK